MISQKAITQKRYSLTEAFKSVPHGNIKDVKRDVMRVLEISAPVQLWRISNGRANPTLSQARAVEEYFKANWGIVDVWKEI
jgi:hypothetical protein